MERIPVVFSADHNFVIPACVAISSLLRGGQGRAWDIHLLLDNDVTDEDRQMLMRVVSSVSDGSVLSFMTVEGEFLDAHVERDISRAAYYRLLIPWLLPQYDRVIYSDVDIIFRGDGAGVLYEQFDMDGLYVAGVNRLSYSSPKDLMYEHITALGLEPDKYINDGFMLINSRLQREDNLLDTYRRLSARVMSFMDQDVINIVCKGKIGYLDAEYNVNPLSMTLGRTEQYHVLHFVGVKPWNDFCLGWNEWWNAYKESAIFDEKYFESSVCRQFGKMKQYLRNEELFGKSFVLRNLRRIKMSRRLDGLVKRTHKLKMNF